MIDIQVLASSSKGNCYKIDDGRSSLLIEAGIPINRIKEGLDYNLSDIEGCLISHEHGDHIKSAEKLLALGISCYMSTGTYKGSKITELYYHSIGIVSSEKPFVIGSWVIQAFDVEHDVEEPLGFICYSKHTKEKLLYLTDTYYTRHIFPMLNYIMIECNHSYEILNQRVAEGSLDPAQKKRLIQSHMALENVKNMLRANDLSEVKEIYLIHLSDGNSDAELFKREIQELTGKPTYVAGD